MFVVDAYFIILLFTEFAFYIFHLSILFLLIVQRNTKFNGAFYNIFRFVLAADFMSFIVFLIVQRISMISYFVEFYETSIIFSSLMSSITQLVIGIQFFGRFLMAFNRFTSIWFPFNYKRFWKRQWYTVLLILIPFLTISWRLHEPFKYVYASNGSVSAINANSNIQAIAKAVSSATYFSATVVDAILNSFSFAKFYYNKKKAASYHIKEKHLLYMSIIIFFVQLGRTSYTLQRYLFPTDENVIAFFSAILPFLNDALALSGSISFFLLSKIARNEYASYYFNKKINLVTTVLISSTQINKHSVMYG